MTSGSPHRWTSTELAVLNLFPKIGIKEVCNRLPELHRSMITRQLTRMGLRHPVKYDSKATEVTCNRPGAPERYLPEWKPLKSTERLLTRPGAMDFKGVKSL